MQTIGTIAINLSLFLYFIHFIPQIYHNLVRPNYLNISVFSLVIYFVATGLDIVYGLGFSYQWQYIFVDIIYLSFLLLQQFQLWRAGQYSQFVHLSLLGWTISILFAAAYLYCTGVQVTGFHIGSKNDAVFWLSGSISSVLWIILWVPQVVKNRCQKQANGYARLFWIVGITIVICDLASAIAFGWKWLNLATSFFSLMMTSLLLVQTVYYTRPDSSKLKKNVL